MCGISGIVSKHIQPSAKQVIANMVHAMQYRGPDGSNTWQLNNGGVHFGHNRLAIIDTGVGGLQPMHYAQRYTIVHNGEIYNYKEVKALLQQKGYQFLSYSDTEVILAAYACWQHQCLQYFDGMFAFAIWDDYEKKLFAARDRFGEKPFYFNHAQQQFLFASEMKALWAAGIEKKPEEAALINFITQGIAQTTNNFIGTYYQHINELPAAHYLYFTPHTSQLVITQYWNIDKNVAIEITEKAAIEQLQSLLQQSVSVRLRSDVAVGTSLSGGLDSATIVAVINALKSTNKIQQSFTAAFPGFEKDETTFAKTVAAKFCIPHFTTTPLATDLVTDFEKLCWHQEVPFSSASVFAQYKVFELVKQQGIKVILDGQGADETLAGYNKYIHWYLQQLISEGKWNSAKKQQQLLQKHRYVFEFGIKNYVAAYMPQLTQKKLQQRMLLQQQQSAVNNNFLKTYGSKPLQKPLVKKLNDILFADTMQNNLPALLHYADRNSMAHGCEIRLPFLQHQLVSFIFSLPAQLKINNGYTKYILRACMQNILPAEIVWRTKKIGFEPPQQLWMQHTSVQEAILQAKTKLVNKYILDKKVLQQPVKAMNAYDAANFDWRYWVAANMI
jgi:asparagine synthase (glutamine-hydrolysing)